MLYALFVVLCQCEKYPLILGVSEDITINSVEMLMMDDILPENLVIFIIEKYDFEQIKTADQLSDWGSIGYLCQAYGKLISFSDVDSDEINFVDLMIAQHENPLVIDTRKECVCKIRTFEKGLVIVRLFDSDPSFVTEITENLPDDVALAFVASTETLFRL